jgi:hypothetical protein
LGNAAPFSWLRVVKMAAGILAVKETFVRRPQINNSFRPGPVSMMFISAEQLFSAERLSRKTTFSFISKAYGY